METLIARLKTLSSAEDFLLFFGVPFEQKVLDVSRLHILKRFFQYLQREQVGQTGQMPEPADAVQTFTAYRALLQRAYGDFVQSTPAREKVFKVFQDAGGTRHVPLASLKASLAARPAQALPALQPLPPFQPARAAS